MDRENLLKFSLLAGIIACITGIIAEICFIFIPLFSWSFVSDNRVSLVGSLIEGIKLLMSGSDYQAMVLLSIVVDASILFSAIVLIINAGKDLIKDINNFMSFEAYCAEEANKSESEIAMEKEIRNLKKKKRGSIFGHVFAFILVFGLFPLFSDGLESVNLVFIIITLLFAIANGVCSFVSNRLKKMSRN